MNNDKNNIVIIGCLSKNEIEKLKELLPKRNIYHKELNVENVIEFLKTFAQEIDNTHITVHLITCILNEDEEIFQYKNEKQSLENVISILNRCCYNKNKEFVQFNIIKTIKNYNQNENHSQIEKIDLVNKFKDMYLKLYGISL